MTRREIPSIRKVDYLSFEEFAELLRETGYPQARWWQRVRAEVSMRATFQQWFRRLREHVDNSDATSPVREMHCSPLDNLKAALTIPEVNGGQPLIRYPYKDLNLMSEGLTFTQLARRESLVYSSCFTIALRDETVNPQPLMRAAKLIRSSVLVWREIATGRHLGGMKGDGLESSGFHDLYSTNRVPVSSACDVLERRPYSSHIVVAIDGLFFPLTVIRDGDALSSSELFTQLRHLELDARSLVADGREPPVGVLTSMERTRWHFCREQLLEHPVSYESLETIESALFLVCLDLDFKNENREMLWRYLRDREAENRWFDKSMQFIVTGASNAAVTFESSAVDVHVASQFVMRLWDFYEKDVAQETTALVFAGEGESRGLEPLEWGLSDQSIWDVTAEASSSHAERRSSWKHSTLKTRSLGRDFFEQEDLNADAVLHLVFQMALHRLHQDHGGGLARSTHTRHVEGGRYSLMPVLTPALMSFIEACVTGQPTRVGLLDAVESIEGRLIRLQSGWDITGMLMALSCFAADGDLIDRVEAIEMFQEGLSANPLVRSLWEPSCVTNGSTDRRAIDFVIPTTAQGSGAITVSYVIRRGYSQIDVWGQASRDDLLQKFCAVVENSLRLVLKVMGEH